MDNPKVVIKKITHEEMRKLLMNGGREQVQAMTRANLLNALIGYMYVTYEPIFPDTVPEMEQSIDLVEKIIRKREDSLFPIIAEAISDLSGIIAKERKHGR